MPGSSLWLVPPEESELYKAIHHLILQNVPAIFPDTTLPQFAPHVTLTSDTTSDQEDPQEWLDNSTLPDSVERLRVRIEQLDDGKIFFQSLIMKCEKSVELCELAVHCRVAGVKDTDSKTAETWVQERFVPHCSLMYSGIPREEVVTKLDEVSAKIVDLTMKQSDCRKANGAEIWLVPTFKSIDQWKPIARRRLEGVGWEWRT
ncbi:hypothetical protein LTR86_005771 [Recurvomyces mirabilis]|nr:hypothetical protein LTR86_005771 [Recurvomyces mirabilis]